MWSVSFLSLGFLSFSAILSSCLQNVLAKGLSDPLKEYILELLVQRVSVSIPESILPSRDRERHLLSLLLSHCAS